MSVRTMSCGHVACSVDPKAAEGGMSRPRVGMLLKLQMFLNGECPAARPNLQAEGAVPKYGHKLAALRRRQVDTVLGRSSHTPKYHGKIESQASSGPDSKPSQDVDFGLLLQRRLQWKDIILDLISLSKSPALAAPSSRPTCSKAKQSAHTHTHRLRYRSFFRPFCRESGRVLCEKQLAASERGLQAKPQPLLKPNG